LGEVFQDYEESIYLIPEAERRKKVGPYLWSAVAKMGFLSGRVYVTSPSMEGLAAWLTPGKTELSIWQMIHFGVIFNLFRAGAKTYARLFALVQHEEKLHRLCAPFPHWYLLLLGVRPEHQGLGYASRLLKPMLNWLDHEQIPCFLFTYRESNVSLYEHFGFKVIKKSNIPKTDCHIWAMLREHI